MNIMVDLETMGTGTNAAIIAIGAVKFDTENFTLGDEFYEVVDLESSVEAGGVIDPSTVLWWMKQSDEARAEFRKEGRSINYALWAFVNFMTTKEGSKSEVQLWGNGATFDNVILRTAFENIHGGATSMFWGDRCYRTMKNMYPNIPMNFEGVAHNALTDAKNQAQHLLDILKFKQNCEASRGEHIA